MKLTVDTPPVPTGNGDEDIARLYNWLAELYDELDFILGGLTDRDEE